MRRDNGVQIFEPMVITLEANDCGAVVSVLRGRT